MLRDLAETTLVATLNVAVRFTDPAGAVAASGIRSGSPAALGFYLDTGRVHVGDEHTALLSAYRAWAFDRAASTGTLCCSPRPATSGRHAQRAGLRRPRRLLRPGRAGAARGRVHGKRGGRGHHQAQRPADAGITATDWVKNGDRFTVHTVRGDSALEVVHRETGRRRHPARFYYVAEHVAAGYAATIHAAQGATADTRHVLLTGAESREQLYVALTRGRHASNLAAACRAAWRRGRARPGSAATHQPAGRLTDLLVRILDREAAQRSATTEQRTLTDPVRRYREAVTRYTDSLGLAPAAPCWRDAMGARAAAVAAGCAGLRRRVMARLPGRPGRADHRARCRGGGR